MDKNLELYNKVKAVPQNAQSVIKGGRLKGKTDINPMWRLKTLTENFGVCGIGWKYEIIEKRLEKGANDEIAAFVDINLYIKQGGQWSEAIQGTGGSMFVAKEREGLYTSDECFKMALTDAISVACKALGVGADIYWAKDTTKYNKDDSESTDPLMTQAQKKAFKELNINSEKVAIYYKTTVDNITAKQAQDAIERQQAAIEVKQKAAQDV